MKRNVGRVMVGTLVSQTFAALSIASTVLLGLEVADIYAVGIQIGNAALSGIVVGVVYLLAVGRPSFDKWLFWTRVAAIFSAVLPIPVVGIVALTQEVQDHDLVFQGAVSLAFGVGGAMLATAGIVAVREACEGRPLALAVLTVVPNFGLICGVALATQFTGANANLLPAIGWVSGTGVLVLRMRPLRSPVSPATVSEAAGLRTHASALGAGVITSSVYPPLYLSAVSNLRDGTAITLSLITRVGSSMVGLFVNSALMVRYNWNSNQSLTGRASSWLNIAAVLLAATSMLVYFAADAKVVSYALVASSWLASIVSSPLVTREMNARRLSGHILAKSVADLVLSTIALIVLWSNPSLTGYLAAIMASQATAGLVAGLGLKNRGLVASSSALVISASALLVLGW